MRFTNSKFRYNYDIIFHCDNLHYAYVSIEEGDVEKISLVLPPSTVKAFRHSDFAATYYSKLSYEEFLKYYITEGYTVVENAVYTENGVFIITDVSRQMEDAWKYYFIDIEFSVIDR